MAKICSRNFFASLVILLSLFITSCRGQNNLPPQVRIVDLQGNSRDLKTRVPELNARILESQGRAPQQNSVPQFQQAPQFQQKDLAASQNPAPQQNSDFGQSTAQAIKDTLQAEPVQKSANSNLLNSDQNSGEQKPNSMTSVGAVADKDQEIEYDLSDSGQQKQTKVVRKMRLKVAEQAPVAVKNDDEEVGVSKSKQKGIFVQTGSFSNEESAKQVLSKTQKFYKGRIEVADSGDKTIYRVLLGPFANTQKAKEMVGKIKNSGREAIVVKNR